MNKTPEWQGDPIRGTQRALTVGQIIGGNVRAQRMFRGMSQAELGKTVGEILTGKALPRQTVTLMERGDRGFQATEVIALAHVFNVSISTLYSEPPDTGSIVVSDRLTIPVEKWEVRPDKWEVEASVSAMDVLREALKVLRQNAEENERRSTRDRRASEIVDQLLALLIDGTRD